MLTVSNSARYNNLNLPSTIAKTHQVGHLINKPTFTGKSQNPIKLTCFGFLNAGIFRRTWSPSIDPSERPISDSSQMTLGPSSSGLRARKMNRVGSATSDRSDMVDGWTRRQNTIIGWRTKSTYNDNDDNNNNNNYYYYYYYCCYF